MKLIDFIGILGGKVKIKGFVTEIYEGEIQKGKDKGKPFFCITLDSEDKLYLYTKRNYDYIEDVEEGKTYEFTVEKSRGFITITGKTEDAPDQEVEKGRERDTEVRTSPAPMTERFYKNRISALTASASFIANTLGATAKDSDVEDIFDMFLKLILGE